MAEVRAASPDQAAFRDELLAAGLLIDGGAPGVYGRSAVFEGIFMAIDALVTRRATEDAAELLRFPPIFPKHHFEDIGYLESFPHLAGSIFSFDGSEADANELMERAGRHEHWGDLQDQTELVLVPAACYPVYPAVAARGPLPAGGVTIDTGSAYVFRNEPSGDPTRLQMFHQRELVRIAEPDTVADWREAWRDRAVALLRELGLDASFDVASDPFFGRKGRLLARSQREQELKFEVIVQIAGPEPTAVASFNYHQDHFSAPFAITMQAGEGAHTACLGFGMERITLALLRTHGLEPGAWPEAVRGELGL